MEYLWLCLSAVAAGAVNAGGGPLLTYPTLAGAFPPVVQAAQNSHRKSAPASCPHRTMARNWKISLLRFQVYV